MAVPGNPSLPTSVSGFTSYLNANFAGDNGKKGSPVSALNESGATLGDQWVSWYNTAFQTHGTTFSLLQYEEAFLVLWEQATFTKNLGQAATTGLGTAGNFVQSAGTALDNLYKQSIFGFLTRLTDQNTWIRVGEFVVGGLLLYVALKGIVTPGGQAPVGRTVKDTGFSVGRGVRKVAKVAVTKKPLRS